MKGKKVIPVTLQNLISPSNNSSALFSELVSSLQGNFAESNAEDSENVSALNESFRRGKTKANQDVFMFSEEEIPSDLELDLNDIPVVRKVSVDAGLPALSNFWPGKSAQYWIPSDENQNGRHLAQDLTSVLLGDKTIAPSSNVPLLLYHAHPSSDVSVLCFKDPDRPFIRRCKLSVEDELYNKALEERRVLLVPDFNIPKGMLLVILPPVSNMGVLESRADISWLFDYISNERERCVFFEEGNSPNTLRQSQALTEIAKDGRLYIVMCAGDLLANPGMQTDINSPKKAVRKMFEKQLSILCPGTWSRLLCDPRKKDFSALVKELLTPKNEAGVYHLRKMNITLHQNCQLVPFSIDVKQSVIAELKNIYLEHLPDLVRTIKENALTDKAAVWTSITSSVTKIFYEAYSSQRDAFPVLSKSKHAMLAGLLFLDFKIASKIANNFIVNWMNLESSLLACANYDSGKHYLWNYFPRFEDICKGELLQLQQKSLKLQRSFAIIAARKNNGDENEE